MLYIKSIKILTNVKRDIPHRLQTKIYVNVLQKSINETKRTLITSVVEPM